VDELGVSQVSAVGEERSAVGVCAREAEPLEEYGGEVDPSAGDAIEHRPHGRMIGGCQQRELDPVARRQLGGAFEQETKLLARILRGGVDLGDHRRCGRLLPSSKRSLDERFAAGEVPVEAAFVESPPLPARGGSRSMTARGPATAQS
jgi:hypothetical protein